MDPARTIIDRLGGATIVGRRVGVHRTRVSSWARPREGGGSNGIIPSRHIPALLEMAREQGVRLELSDFFIISSLAGGSADTVAGTLPGAGSPVPGLSGEGG